MKKKNGLDALYIASLPERTIRSLVSATTGVTSLATRLLVPKFIKESSTYRVTFGMLQQFLIQKVAEVEMEEKEFEVKEKYIIRKTAGTFIEGIGLLSVSFSPVWMLAILSDVTGGSKIYIQRLVNDMKKNQIVDASANYDNVYDLLDGIKASSKIGVDAIDMPPITMEEFGQFKDSLTSSLKANGDNTKKMMKALEDVWDKMQHVGKEENVSVSKLNGAMTLDLMKTSARKGIDLTKSTAETTFGIFNDIIIESYKESIEEVTKKGKRKYLIEHMDPFMRQFSKHYNKDKKTLTEKGLGFFRKK